MRIKSFDCFSGTNTLPTISCSFNAPVCFLRGQGADALLDLMREILGDRNTGGRLNGDRSAHVILHAVVEIDDRVYRVCYVRNPKEGECRIAVNFEKGSLGYSLEDTLEYRQKCAALDQGVSNVLVGTAAATDPRPVFIYDFDRLDESIDITPSIDALSSTKRQVFISVCANYPIDNLKRDDVQIVEVKIDNGND